MEKLTKEEVLHVANLARLGLTENEIEKFSYQLKEILNEIEKINDIEVEENDILIAPWSTCSVLSKDEVGKHIEPEDVILNAPHKIDSYIEVRGAFDE